MSFYLAGEDNLAIAKQLQQGNLLVACMCADWCDSCRLWLDIFRQIATKNQESCFVWLDIDENPELVAEIDLEILPVLLVQKENEVYFIGTIEPRKAIVEQLLQQQIPINTPNPGVYQFLCE